MISSYALTSGSFLLLWGKLGDVYGRKLLFILGAAFTAATCIGTAFSPVEICLYVMRAFHGLASAVTIPTAIGIIGHTIPPGRVKNYSFAFYSGGAPMGQVLGNLMVFCSIFFYWGFHSLNCSPIVEGSQCFGPIGILKSLERLSWFRILNCFQTLKASSFWTAV